MNHRLFNEKIDHFRDHKGYALLRENADNALLWVKLGGWMQIMATDFIKRIERASIEYISDWLDGKNELMWSDIRKGGAK